MVAVTSSLESLDASTPAAPRWYTFFDVWSVAPAS